MQLIRDFVAINHLEKKLNRPLTEEEKCGIDPIKTLTEDGLRTFVYVDILPFKYFFPDGARRL